MSGITNIFGSSGASKVDQVQQSASLGNMSSADIKKQVQEQIVQELAVTNATELVNKITANCFESCFPKPGASISNSEKECTKQCMEKYMHAWNLLSRTYITRIQQASATGQI